MISDISGIQNTSPLPPQAESYVIAMALYIYIYVYPVARSPVLGLTFGDIGKQVGSLVQKQHAWAPGPDLVYFPTERSIELEGMLQPQG